jgi:hypothetical protein
MLFGNLKQQGTTSSEKSGETNHYALDLVSNVSMKSDHLDRISSAKNADCRIP